MSYSSPCWSIHGDESQTSMILNDSESQPACRPSAVWNPPNDLQIACKHQPLKDTNWFLIFHLCQCVFYWFQFGRLPMISADDQYRWSVPAMSLDESRWPLPMSAHDQRCQCEWDYQTWQRRSAGAAKRMKRRNLPSSHFDGINWIDLIDAEIVFGAMLTKLGQYSFSKAWTPNLLNSKV